MSVSLNEFNGRALLLVEGQQNWYQTSSHMLTSSPVPGVALGTGLKGTLAALSLAHTIKIPPAALFSPDSEDREVMLKNPVKFKKQ